MGMEHPPLVLPDHPYEHGAPPSPHSYPIDEATEDPPPYAPPPQPQHSSLPPPPWSRTHLSTSARWVGLVMAAMYCMMYLLASVLPAPLSPGKEGRDWARGAHPRVPHTQLPPPPNCCRPPTRNDDAGVLGAALHGLVSGVGQGKEVGWALVELAAAIAFHRRRAVEVQHSVRVHRHHHLPNVGVDATLQEPARRGGHGAGVAPCGVLRYGAGRMPCTVLWGRMTPCGVLCHGVGCHPAGC